MHTKCTKPSQNFLDNLDLRGLVRCGWVDVLLLVILVTIMSEFMDCFVLVMFVFYLFIVFIYCVYSFLI